MKICPNCAKQNRNDTNYCTNCGYSLVSAPIKESPQDKVQTPTKTLTAEQEEFFRKAATKTVPLPLVAPRSIPVAVLLTFITCGMYGFYWMAKENDELNELINDPTAMSGAAVVLLTILTGGIYGIFWAYRMGEKIDYLKMNQSNDTRILYLILSILGLGIVPSILIQDEINKYVKQL